MPPILSEELIEDETLEWLAAMGYEIRKGAEIDPNSPIPERNFQEVILKDRLFSALERLNPAAPLDVLEEAATRMVTGAAFGSPDPIEQNRMFHALLVNGIPSEQRQPDGSTRHIPLKLLDFEDFGNNAWLAVNQFTVIEKRENLENRRPDVVLFVNGLPLAVLELKDPKNKNAHLLGAYNQLQTYKTAIPSLFPPNVLLVCSDGVNALAGTITSNYERFSPWRTIDGKGIAPPTAWPLQVLVEGIFEPKRFLELIRYFIVFEQESPKMVKKVAAYHQFHAVRKAVEHTVSATAPGGDRKVGVVWHTQGSGKSLTMVFYAARIAQEPAMGNPTLLVITDRNDLDDQLFSTFSRCFGLLGQKPKQVTSRADLREQLTVASGGIVFTTIQKFFPESGEAFPMLSNRRNIVVIADEAHRTQYGLAGKVKVGEESADISYGFAKHLRDALPEASFIGFTGTPVSSSDRNTRAIFGDYIDIYDIQRAVEDKSTVPIYYESRLARIAINEEERRPFAL